MKRLKVLGIILLAGNLAIGCSSLTSNETVDVMNATPQEMVFEIATPITPTSEEQGTPEELAWTELGSLTDVQDLRDIWDEVFNVSGTPGNKTGELYVTSSGQYDNNTTLQMALHNGFVRDILQDDESEEFNKLADAADKVYTDLDDEENYNKILMALNGYFDIVQDNEPGYSNPGQTLTRAQVMSAIMRAKTQVSTNLETNSDFESAVGESIYNKFAQELDKNSFVSTKDKSLNEDSYNLTMTRAEAVYLLVNTFLTDELQSANGQNEEAEFGDLVNAGNIADNLGLSSTDGEGAASYESLQIINEMLKNPDNGVDNRIYKAFLVAYEHNIVPYTTEWDNGITKLDFLRMLVDTLMEDPSIEIFNETTSEDGSVISLEDEVEGNGAGLSDNSGSEELLNSIAVEEEENIPEEKAEVNSLNKNKTKKKYTVKSISEKTMYATSDCNIRKGPSTNYDRVGSLSRAQKVTVNGKVTYQDKTWFRLKTTDGSEQFVASSLLSDTKPTTTQKSNTQKSNTNSSNTQKNTNNNSTKPSNNTQKPSNNTQKPSSSGGGYTSIDDIPIPDDWGGESDSPESGSDSGYGERWNVE